MEVELAKDFEEMFKMLSLYLYRSPTTSRGWSSSRPGAWSRSTPAATGGVFIHGGLEGSEINKIQERAEMDKNLRIFATNVIASSVNIYVDNVLIFNEVIDGKDKLGQKIAPVQEDRQQLAAADDREDRPVQARPGGHHLRHARSRRRSPRYRCARRSRRETPVRPGAPHVEVRPQALGARVHVEGEPPRGRLRGGLAHRDRGDRPPDARRSPGRGS